MNQTRYDAYEMVIGLEVHAELCTETKLFCACPVTFGAPPNTQCCPVCMGMPGALPVLNRRAIEFGIRAGLAANCTIAEVCCMDRKQYFYPDLPKAYQISQYDQPLCANGFLEINCKGGTKRIGITRMHIEEDAGKLIHDGGNGTLLDCNRCGVPLLEIVSEPDLRTAEEAVAYVRALRSLLLYVEVSDGKMQEGSLRCDVNLSVRKKGEKAFGTRTEMKNINSFTFIAAAIEYEFHRQVDLLESGGKVSAETRRFDQSSGKTLPMRSKESSADYRFLPDPDLLPVTITRREVEETARKLPMLAAARCALYREGYAIGEQECAVLTRDRALADSFEEAVRHTSYPTILAHLMTGELLRLLPADFSAAELPKRPALLGKIADMMGEGSINSSTAKRLVNEVLYHDNDPEALVRARGWEQIRDRAVLASLVREVIANAPKAVADYRSGKTAAAKAIVGRVMAKTEGRGDAALIDALVLSFLNETQGSESESGDLLQGKHIR